jgi:hypothetical protein
VSWDEAFAVGYDEWSAHMTEDVACYVGLARAATGPWSSWRWGTDVSRSRSGPFRALLHLATWADRRRTFERVAASLRPGGRFAWNAFAFDRRPPSQ